MNNKIVLILIVCCALTVCLALFGAKFLFTKKSEANGTVRGGLNSQFKHATSYGIIPNDFKLLVKEDRLNGAYSSNSHILKTAKSDAGYLVYELNPYGEPLIEITLPDKRASDWRSSLRAYATDDGGILVSIGFEDYCIDQAEDHWASDDGVMSSIYKFSSNGTEEWHTDLTDVTSQMLQLATDCRDGYLFFGERETPETKRKGVYSYADVSVLKLDKNGALSDMLILQGSDYESVYNVLQNGDIYSIIVRSQSKDGDFSIDKHLSRTHTVWEYTIDQAFKILNSAPLKDQNSAEPSYWMVGFIDSKPVYRNDVRFQNALGYVSLVIDLDETYLVVSTNNYGIYETEPAIINSMWYLTESVYSVYDKSDVLLWRGVVDSTPWDSYDGIAAEFARSLKEPE